MLVHHSILTRNGVSGKPGPVQGDVRKSAEKKESEMKVTLEGEAESMPPMPGLTLQERKRTISGGTGVGTLNGGNRRRMPAAQRQFVRQAFGC